MERKEKTGEGSEGVSKDRGKRRKEGEWGSPGSTGDTEPSFALLGLLPLCAMFSVPATSWNVRCLMVRTHRQGPDAGWTQAGGWQQK